MTSPQLVEFEVIYDDLDLDCLRRLLWLGCRYGLVVSSVEAEVVCDDVNLNCLRQSTGSAPAIAGLVDSSVKVEVICDDLDLDHL